MSASRRPVTTAEEDALGEVANIMIGHAATALAQLSHTRIDIRIPKISVLPWEEGVKAASGDADIVAGVRTRMLGKLTGDVFVTFPKASALALSDVLRGMPRGHTRYMSSAAAAALVEVGNIVAGSCLAAFYHLLDISIVHSVPEFVYDAPSVLISRETRTVEDGEKVLLAQVAFDAPEMDLRGHLILLFTMESMSRLLGALDPDG